MNLPAHLLLFPLYAALAVAVWLRLVPLPASLVQAPSDFSGLLVLAGGFGLHAVVAIVIGERRRTMKIKRLDEALGEAVGDQRRLEGEINHLRNALLDLRDRPGEKFGAVVAEVKVLQSLIGQLYSARTGDAAGGSASASKPASASIPASILARSAGPAQPRVAEGLDPQQILDLVREGLRENGVELALQPIVSLPQRKRRHFECFSRIRTPDGKIILPEQYIEIAERNGLITAIDNLLLLRCLQTLRRIRKGNADVGFFLNISPHTLADRGFFREFIGLMTQNADLAPALIFELPQRALNEADSNLGRDLERLAQMGFRFSLDQVSDLNLDVAQLSSAQFRFLKLDAQRLLRATREGLLGGDAKQFKKLLDSYGIDLVVERIETEPMLLELLDLHIDFGQGYLFGEPRFARFDSNIAAS